MSSEAKIQQVMVAVDGSPPSQNALKYAIFTASKFGAQLVVFSVVEQEKVGYWQFIDEHFKKSCWTRPRRSSARPRPRPPNRA